VHEPFKYYHNNVGGSLNLIEACSKAGVKNFIFSSTCSLYGNTKTNPISEDFPTEAVSPYAKTKLVIEGILKDAEASGKFAMKNVILRYFNVGGARVAGGLGQATPNATQLIKIAAEVACGKREKMFLFGTDYPTPDGTCIRDYIHVDDLAEAHVLALDYLRKGGKSDIFNCGYGKGYSVREVIQSMERACGHKLKVEERPRRAGDVVAVWADTLKVKSGLGWKPRYENLDLICKTAYDWEKSYKS
jgi:UDP-glucose 4-epimerase